MTSQRNTPFHEVTACHGCKGVDRRGYASFPGVGTQDDADHALVLNVAQPDLLAVARLRGTTPPELALVGMHPASIELGWGLSDVVSARLDDIVASAATVLYQWGVVVERRSSVAEAAEHTGSILPELEARDA